MKRFGYILGLVLGLTACSSTSTIPLDDAYIWPEKTQTETATTVTSEQAPSMPVTETPAPATPTLEYTNIQDTTITVKIKR